MSQTLMVTGGTGYIGAWVVYKLLSRGDTVRVMVRDMNNTAKTQALIAVSHDLPGSLEFWEADLLTPGSFDAAAKGTEVIYHIASPFSLRKKDPQRELVDPALNGTRNVLATANASPSVRKVVLTSSVVAIYGDAIEMHEQGLTAFTEQSFNTTSSLTHRPYAYSKVLAEKEAWKLHTTQDQWELVVINPGFVMGPALNYTSDSESLVFMRNLLSGKFRIGVPDMRFTWVDVRDVAEAHILAADNPNARGRHILVDRTLSLLEMAEVVRAEFGNKYALPSWELPKWLLYTVGSFVGFTATYVGRNVGHPLQFDNTKSRKELGLAYTPISKTFKDMILDMEKRGLV